MVARIDAASLRLQSKVLPKLVTDFSVIYGIAAPSIRKRNLSTTFPRLRTMDLDFVGLKLILAQRISFSRPCRIHQHPGTDVVVTVKSSMKARIGGCRIPDLDKGPLQSVSAALTSMFMARANRMTEIVQPVMIPFLSRCQSDVTFPADIGKVKPKHRQVSIPLTCLPDELGDNSGMLKTAWHSGGCRPSVLMYQHTCS